jgi:type II secretory pathway component PulC
MIGIEFEEVLADMWELAIDWLFTARFQAEALKLKVVIQKQWQSPTTEQPSPASYQTLKLSFQSDKIVCTTTSKALARSYP